MVEVESTQDLLEAMKAEAPRQDIIIQAAAPADYRPVDVLGTKIKKQEGKELVLRLTETPDVAKAVGLMKREGQILVGFAAETDHVLEHAKGKLKRKNLDLIVANDVTQPGAGFSVDTNIASLVTADGIDERPLQSKRALAEDILDKVNELRR